MNYFQTKYKSFLGEIIILSDGENVTHLFFSSNPYKNVFDKNIIIKKDNLEIFEYTNIWLDSYFNNRTLLKIPKIKPYGTTFQQKIWNLLLEIPYGKTSTYQAIKEKYIQLSNKKNMATQAVGNAIAKNPILILIPCHRIIGTDGNIKGYSGGVDKKIKLLDMENINSL